MDVKTLFEKCLDQAVLVMSQVKPSQFKDRTPDTEWDVQALINHIFYELSWVPDILQGKTIAEVGSKYDGDLIGGDLKSNWDEAVDGARDAVSAVDIASNIHLSFGDFPAEYYLRQESKDQLIHAWDLGVAIGMPVKFDPEVAEELYKATLPRKERMASSGMFAPALDVPESPDIQVKLLALMGRDAAWKIEII